MSPDSEVATGRDQPLEARLVGGLGTEPLI